MDSNNLLNSFSQLNTGNQHQQNQLQQQNKSQQIFRSNAKGQTESHFHTSKFESFNFDRSNSFSGSSPSFGNSNFSNNQNTSNFNNLNRPSFSTPSFSQETNRNDSFKTFSSEPKQQTSFTSFSHSKDAQNNDFQNFSFSQNNSFNSPNTTTLNKQFGSLSFGSSKSPQTSFKLNVNAKEFEFKDKNSSKSTEFDFSKQFSFSTDKANSNSSDLSQLPKDSPWSMAGSISSGVSAIRDDTNDKKMNDNTFGFVGNNALASNKTFNDFDSFSIGFGHDNGVKEDSVKEDDNTTKTEQNMSLFGGDNTVKVGVNEAKSLFGNDNNIDNNKTENKNLFGNSDKSSEAFNFFGTNKIESNDNIKSNDKIDNKNTKNTLDDKNDKKEQKMTKSNTKEYMAERTVFGKTFLVWELEEFASDKFCCVPLSLPVEGLTF